MKFIQHLLLVFTLILLLVGCGGSGESTSSNNALAVDGAAVKGPLINASVNAYVLDTSRSDLKGELVAVGVTDEKAQLQLEIAESYLSNEAFIIEYLGGTEMDSSMPVIETLLTLITADQLRANVAAYATPLSTFAIRYAGKIADSAGIDNDMLTDGLIGNGDSTVSVAEFFAAIDKAAELIRDTLGLGVLNDQIDLFTTSPIIDRVNNPQDALALRTANEVFAAIVAELSVEIDVAGGSITGNALVERLAEDFTDGNFDRKNGAMSITELNDIADLAAIFNQNPLTLTVPGTQQTIADLPQIMLDELAELGGETNSNIDQPELPAPVTAPATSVEENEPSPVIVPEPQNSAPTVNFATPANGTVVTEGSNLSVVLNASDSDGSIAYCDLLFDNSLVNRDSSAPFTFAGGNALNNIAAGDHTLRANCVDNQGLSSVATLISVSAIAIPTPDPIAPSVAFAMPAPNTVLDAGDNITVLLSASDSDGQISHCDLSLNGLLVRRDSNSPYSFGSGDTALTNLPSGAHTLLAQCTDNSGLTASASRSFSVNAFPVAPSLSFATPVNNHQLDEGGSISVALNANDSDGSIAYCELSLNGSLVRRDTNSPYTFGSGDAALNNLSAGNYTLSAVCLDNSGLAAAASRAFTVNQQPVAPTVSFATPAANHQVDEGGSVSVALNVNDSDGSIAYCELSLNGTRVRRDITSPYTFGAGDAALNNLTVGDYTLTAVCLDDGGLTDSASRGFTVNPLSNNPVPPTVAFSAPVNNASFESGDAISVSLNAADADGSINHCDLLVNGQLVRRDSSAPFNFGNGSGFSDTALSSLTDGSHTLAATCVDDENLSASTSVSISVSAQQAQTGNVLLDWVTPTTREDGSSLAVSEIDSYAVLYYPTNNVNASVNITVAADDGNGGLVSSYLISNISSGSYEFSIATIDVEGNVSAFANPVALTIP